jgi:hypothetical protein
VSASGECIPASVSITLNVGASTYPVETCPLGAVDSIAKAAVVQRVVRESVRQVLADWPKTVYSEQIEKLVREICNNRKAERS